MNRMLISAAQGELRVAVVNGNILSNLDIDRADHAQKKSNIYKSRITRVVPSLEAAFVEYGGERHGFLPLKEISREYFKPDASGEPGSKINIHEVIETGTEIIVQVDKEERGNKGASLTTFISLAGSYLVLMPNNPRAGGISRRIEGHDRDELRKLLSSLPLPKDMGVIVRTAGMNKSKEELEWDLEVLLTQWQAIQAAAKEHPAPCLIHQESNVTIRALRDYLRPDIDEIVIDTQEVYDKVKQYLGLIKPDFCDRVCLYQNKGSMFNYYQIEPQIETIYRRSVNLPSGGAIVINPTEALVSIDVNSAKATTGSDIEETAFATNLEAADEIARQLRLRDIGGLVVIDFIDMMSIRNQREVVNRLRNALRQDRARVQVGNISSRFGLLEMSRQRLRSAIGEAIQVPCPRCDGQGMIRSIKSLASSLLRLIENETMRRGVAQVEVQLPVDLATYIYNEKRPALNYIEQQHKVKIVILPNPYLESPKYRMKRLRQSDLAKDNQAASYATVTTPEIDMPVPTGSGKMQPVEIPLVKNALPNTPRARTPGFFTKLWRKLFTKKPVAKHKSYRRNNNRRYNSRYNNRRSGQRYNNNRHHNSRRGNRGGNKNRG